MPIKPQTFSLADMIRVTAQSKEFKNRFEYSLRDKVSAVRVEKVRAYIISHKKYYSYYRVTTRSYPAYLPTREAHKYDVSIVIDKLDPASKSLKLRTGRDAQWKTGRDNTAFGINGDFHFRLSYVYKYHGLLNGRNWATAPPVVTNPRFIPFLDKHMLRALKKIFRQKLDIL